MITSFICLLAMSAPEAMQSRPGAFSGPMTTVLYPTEEDWSEAQRLLGQGRPQDSLAALKPYQESIPAITSLQFHHFKCYMAMQEWALARDMAEMSYRKSAEHVDGPGYREIICLALTHDLLEDKERALMVIDLSRPRLMQRLDSLHPDFDIYGLTFKEPQLTRDLLLTFSELNRSDSVILPAMQKAAPQIADKGWFRMEMATVLLRQKRRSEALDLLRTVEEGGDKVLAEQKKSRIARLEFLLRPGG